MKLSYSLCVVCRDAGTIFGNSHIYKNMLSPNTYRDGKLVGQASLRPLDRKDLAEAICFIILCYEGVKTFVKAAVDSLLSDPSASSESETSPEETSTSEEDPK